MNFLWYLNLFSLRLTVIKDLHYPTLSFLILLVFSMNFQIKFRMVISIDKIIIDFLEFFLSITPEFDFKKY